MISSLDPTMIASAGAPSPVSLLLSSPQIDLRRSPPALHPRRRRPSVCPPISASACASAAEREHTYYYTSARIGAARAAPPPPAPSLYEVLGVAAGATGEEIKLAYRRLARECHPDVVAVDRRDASADRFMLVHAAYATLSDPHKRVAYDSELLLLSRQAAVVYRPVSSSPQAAGYPLSGIRRRTWETDQCW